MNWWVISRRKGLYHSKPYWILFILASVITECMSIFVFAYLLGIPMRITSSAIGLKISAVTAGIKKYKSIIKKNKKKHDKLYSIEVLICKSLINSFISYEEFALINNELKEYDDMKDGINNLKTSWVNYNF